jgi:hypothetical protein
MKSSQWEIEANIPMLTRSQPVKRSVLDRNKCAHAKYLVIMIVVVVIAAATIADNKN